MNFSPNSGLFPPNIFSGLMLLHVNIKLDIRILVFVKMIPTIKLLCEVKISFTYVKFYKYMYVLTSKENIIASLTN